MIKISNGKIISDNKIISGKSLYIDDGKIKYVTNENLPFDKEINAFGNYISAGFIDLHTHGGGGYDFMDGGVNPIVEGLKLHLSHGTTSIMPTTLTSTTETLKSCLADIKQAMSSTENIPNIVGVHLEGPYFSLNQKGAQNPHYITSPDEKEYNDIIEFAEGIIKRWSFAPELPGSVEFCKTLVKNNIVPSIAHSDAVYEDVKKVYEQGCRLVTHFYSGMSSITRHNGFRKLGVIESAYLLDMDVEIIADGIHLPPELLQMICNLKSADKISLVTDSMRGAGMGDGESMLGTMKEGMPCIIEDGVAKLMDRTAFAGSVATADRLIRTMIKSAGVSIENAVKMITKNPARILDLDKKGDIKEGFDADLVIFDEDINIDNVFVMGKPLELLA